MANTNRILKVKQDVLAAFQGEDIGTDLDEWNAFWKNPGLNGLGPEEQMKKIQEQ